LSLHIEFDTNQYVLIPMSNKSMTPNEIIEEEKEVYLVELPKPDPGWPADIRTMYTDVHKHLFDFDSM